jgi:hypothetical protein
MSAPESPPVFTLGDAVGAVRWDYDPQQRLLSPLVAASLYFAEFPWEGEEEDDPPPVVSSPSIDDAV